MSPIKSNLEPIEESDLNLEGKLKHGSVDFSGNRNIPESAPALAIEREKPQEISAGEKDAASYGKILSKVQAQTNDVNQEEVVSDAQTGVQKTDAESQIQHLVDIAQQKGVIHAVKVARHMESNYVLDTFHDRILADELHDALVKKGMITEI
jgi:asparagine synthetase B (glutamine-hydrolysing)